MTSAEDIRDFYNDTFFQDGKAREAQLDMTIVSGASTVRIHSIKVGPGTNLDAIFRAYYAFLKANGPVETDAEPMPDKDRLIDFEVVTYKGKRYFIEERPDELRAEGSGLVVPAHGPSGPDGRGVRPLAGSGAAAGGAVVGG